MKIRLVDLSLSTLIIKPFLSTKKWVLNFLLKKLKMNTHN